MLTGGPGCSRTALCTELLWPTSAGGHRAGLAARVLGWHLCQAQDADTLSPHRFVLGLVQPLERSPLLQGYRLPPAPLPADSKLDPDEAFKRRGTTGVAPSTAPGSPAGMGPRPGTASGASVSSQGRAAATAAPRSSPCCCWWVPWTRGCWWLRVSGSHRDAAAPSQSCWPGTRPCCPPGCCWSAQHAGTARHWPGASLVSGTGDWGVGGGGHRRAGGSRGPPLMRFPSRLLLPVPGRLAEGGGGAGHAAVHPVPAGP